MLPEPTQPVQSNEDDCEHLSWSGDEGPIETLGRFPNRWRCDGCGIIRNECWEERCHERGDLYRTTNDMHLKTYLCANHAHRLGDVWERATS